MTARARMFVTVDDVVNNENVGYFSFEFSILCISLFYTTYDQIYISNINAIHSLFLYESLCGLNH